MNQVLSDENQSWLVNAALSSITLTCAEIRDFAIAPHVLMRPAISIDGNQWCALYGENLQDGVAGFGDSPDAAMQDFDKSWLAARAVANSSVNPLFDLPTFPSIRPSAASDAKEPK